MSEYTESVLKLLKVVREKKFLFPKHMPSKMDMGEYLVWFEEHNKTEFSQMPAMVHLKPEILDKYKKNIVWTGFAPTNPVTGNHALHTLVQVNKDYHIVFIFANEDDEVSLIATLYLSDPKAYVKFFDDNEDFIFKTKEKGIGFSANSVPGFGMLPNSKKDA